MAAKKVFLAFRYDSPYAINKSIGVPGPLASLAAENAALLYNDPGGFINGINTLADSIKSDPTMLADLIASMPQTIKDKQDLENPYTPGSALYYSFATGWYSGYIGIQILMTAAGGEALEAIKSSEEFSTIISSVASKIDEIKVTLKASKAFRVTDKVGAFLSDNTAVISLGLDDRPGIIAAMKTAAKQAKVTKCFIDIGSTKLTALRGYHAELGEFLSITGDEGINIVKTMDESELKDILSFKDLAGEGITSDLMGEYRTNLIKLRYYNKVSITDIDAFETNVEKLESVNGLNRILDRVSKANDYGNFKGAAFEVEYPVNGNVGDIIEMGRPSIFSDPKLTKPGDIDFIRMEGNVKVGYELKDRNFASWTKYQEDISDINNGFKDMVQNGKIGNYKIMFRQRPPNDVVSWLNSENIPWDYFVR